ncbi:thioredoxin [Candidatus Dependentiae bacterium]
MAKDVTKENFDSEVRNSDLPVVIDAFAPWCGPCKLLAPVFEELSTELEGKYKLLKLNVDDSRELAVEFEVMSVPTLLFFKEGKVVGRETGVMDKEALKAKMSEYFG